MNSYSQVLYSHDEFAIKPLKRRRLPSYLNPAIPPKPESKTPWLDDIYNVTNIFLNRSDKMDIIPSFQN